MIHNCYFIGGTCPTCGRCPTCGHHRPTAHWQPPVVIHPIWVKAPVLNAQQTIHRLSGRAA